MAEPREAVLFAERSLQPGDWKVVCGGEMPVLSEMTLSEKQREFPLMLAALVTWAYEQGYEFTLGEAYRTPEQAVLNAAKGTGVVNSLHTQRLAIDLNLFKDGVYLTKTEDHELIGRKWEEMGGSWGGRFRDGNHYSLEHNGMR